MNCSTFTQAAKSMGSTFGGFLGGARRHLAQAATGMQLQQRFQGAFRGIANDSMRTMFNDSGDFIRAARGSSMDARQAVSAGVGGWGQLRSGYARNMRIGLGVGAVAGAGNAYRNDDGPGGYALNIGTGLLAGGAGAHLTSMAMTQGTKLNSGLSSLRKPFTNVAKGQDY